jgi:predicted PurR-regulated permease PerM
MKQIAWYAAVVFATLAVLMLLWTFRIVFVLFLFAIALGSAVRPLVGVFSGLVKSRAVSLALAWLVVFALLAAILVPISGGLGVDLGQLSNQAAVGYERIYTAWPDGSTLQMALSAQLPPPETLYELYGADGMSVVVQVLLGVTANLLGMIGGILLLVVLSIYWSADRVRFERLWQSLLPVASRSRARSIWHDIEERVGAYLRLSFVRLVLTGLLLGLGLWLMGIDYPVLLSVSGAVLSLIPWLGVILVSLPVFLAALSGGLPLAIAATIYAVLVLILMESVVLPRLFERQNYSSLLMVLIAVALADTLGIFAVLLAPPLAAIMQLLFQHLRHTPQPTLSIHSVRRIADLKERVLELESMSGSGDGETAPQIRSLIERLDTLVNRANELIKEEAD